MYQARALILSLPSSPFQHYLRRFEQPSSAGRSSSHLNTLIPHLHRFTHHHYTIYPTRQDRFELALLTGTRISSADLPPIMRRCIRRRPPYPNTNSSYLIRPGHLGPQLPRLFRPISFRPGCLYIPYGQTHPQAPAKLKRPTPHVQIAIIVTPANRADRTP